VAVGRAPVLQPAAVVGHEVAEVTILRIVGVPEKRQVAGRQTAGLRRPLLAKFFQIDRKDQGTGVIVRRVAFRIVGHRGNRVLQNSHVVGQTAQVPKVQSRQFRLLLGQGFRREDRARPRTTILTRPLEGLHVVSRYGRPDHLATGTICLLANRVALRLVLQQLEDGVCQSVGRCKGNEDSAAVRQEFFGVPVGRGDHRLAGTQRVGQRAGSDLVLAQVGRDVDVGRADELHQFLQADEAVVEDHAAFHVQVAGQPL